MQVLYVTDLHGDIEKYERILQIANETQIKYIINGGDMLPKRGNIFEKQQDFICFYLRDYFKRLADNDITYLCMLGNDDLGALDKLFENVCNNFSNVFNIANNKVIINGYEFIGMNYVLDYPFSLKDRVVIEDDFSFERQRGTAIYTTSGDIVQIQDWEKYAKENLNIMKDLLDELPLSDNDEKTIYVIHMPPAHLSLGITYDCSISLGSKEIYRFIEKKRPMLTLHGHIHESPNTGKKLWRNKIENTDCIQPGQTEKDDTEIIYVSMDLDLKHYDRKVDKIKNLIK